MNRATSTSPHPPGGGLATKTVLVTRAAGQSSQFADLLTAQGATVIEMPALEIRPPSSWAPLDAAIAELPSFHWLILTSANAVTFFFERLAIAAPTATLDGLNIAVVGRKTAQVLSRYGRSPDYIPPNFVADDLVATFPVAVGGLRILFPRVESGGREVLVQEMTAAGATVVEVPAYESGCPAVPDAAAIAALQAQRVAVITFASSKTVRHTVQLLAQALGETWQDVLNPIAIASIGPQTSETCHELLGRVDIEATEYTLDGLTQAIATWASASLA